MPQLVNGESIPSAIGVRFNSVKYQKLREFPEATGVVDVGGEKKNVKFEKVVYLKWVDKEEDADGNQKTKKENQVVVAKKGAFVFIAAGDLKSNPVYTHVNLTDACATGAYYSLGEAAFA